MLNLFFVVLCVNSEKTNNIVVTWSTFNDTQESVVEYGVNGMDRKAVGKAKIFVDGGKEHREQWIHRVTLKNLKFDTKYGEFSK